MILFSDHSMTVIAMFAIVNSIASTSLVITTKLKYDAIFCDNYDVDDDFYDCEEVNHPC